MNQDKPQAPEEKREPPRPFIGAGGAILVGALIIVMAMGYCVTQVVPRAFGRNESRITHDVVVSQVRAVAKLVSSEATVRDVVAYENTWYGSTKRSLVVVTGRLLAGIDLQDQPEVSIDHENRKISITIPPARLLAAEITDMKTYDERGGLWNPFKPEDRDAIRRMARAQIVAAGQQVELLRHANGSAAEMLKMLLGKDGYDVEVKTRGAPRDTTVIGSGQTRSMCPDVRASTWRGRYRCFVFTRIATDVDGLRRVYDANNSFDP